MTLFARWNRSTRRAEEEYIGITPTHSLVSVAVTTTPVVAANDARTALLLQNISDTDMYLKLGAAAVVGTGIKLTAGQSYEMAAQYGNLYRGAINAIHGGSSTKTLLVTEGV